MAWFQQVLTLALAPVAVIAAVTWLLRSLFSQALTRDIANFKAKLQTETFREQHRFQSLHAKQAEVVAELYARIVHAERKIGQLTSRFRSVSVDLNEQKTAAAVACDSFGDFYRKHRLYLPEATAIKVDELSELFIDLYVDIDTAQPGDEYHPSNAAAWAEANQRMATQVRPVKQDLESQFRLILGVD
jgi:hypothetical protein